MKNSEIWKRRGKHMMWVRALHGLLIKDCHKVLIINSKLTRSVQNCPVYENPN